MKEKKRGLLALFGYAVLLAGVLISGAKLLFVGKKGGKS